jgi:hypothetical protein
MANHHHPTTAAARTMPVAAKSRDATRTSRGKQPARPTTLMAALFVLTTAAGTAYGQATPGERAVQRFMTRCVEMFPDLDRIRAAAEQAGWRPLIRASESQRKGPYYSELYEHDEQATGERPSLDIKLIGRNAYCATGSSAREGFPIERFAREKGWTEDPQAADVFNKGYPETFTRVFRTRQDGRRVNIIMTTNDVSTYMKITYLGVLGSDPP